VQKHLLVIRIVNKNHIEVCDSIILKSTNELLLSSSNNKHSSSSFGVSEFEVNDEHQESTSEHSRHLQMPTAHLKHNNHKCQKVSL